MITLMINEFNHLNVISNKFYEVLTEVETQSHLGNIFSVYIYKQNKLCDVLRAIWSHLYNLKT